MGESKRELAIKILKENACMFNSCLAKDELKHFKNYDFVQYLINCLSIPEHNYENCHNATCKRKSRKDGYEQAVDDFSKDVKDLIVDLSVIRFKHIDEIADAVYKRTGIDYRTYWAECARDDSERLKQEVRNDNKL